MSDKYRRVNKPAADQPSTPDEIRFTGIGQRKNYILYALSKLNGTGEETQRKVRLKGMGAAVNKVVSVAEIIKRRVVGLHQITTISSTHIVDTYEPLEQGLKTVTIEKSIPTIEIVLSLDPLDTSAAGYQSPLPESAVSAPRPASARGRGGRGGGRGGRGGRTSTTEGHEGAAATADAEDTLGTADGEPKRGRGGRRGGRGGRGRGRGRGRGGDSSNSAATPGEVGQAA